MRSYGSLSVASQNVQLKMMVAPCRTRSAAASGLDRSQPVIWIGRVAVERGISNSECQSQKAY